MATEQKELTQWVRPEVFSLAHQISLVIFFVHLIWNNSLIVRIQEMGGRALRFPRLGKLPQMTLGCALQNSGQDIKTHESDQQLLSQYLLLWSRAAPLLAHRSIPLLLLLF